MAFPIKTCVVCDEEFELKPDKPGYANRCPACSSPDAGGAAKPGKMTAEEAAYQRGADAERRKAIKDMLYSKK